ncbi:Uncharacterised protein [Mycobacteroides abscessus subsp. abscessus]|nr:Uncharacterised protein [Mycobacteroides abscessus subsp. abscessus]
MLKMACPSWIAVTRRVTNDLPSRTRSTRNTVGSLGFPGRRKYPCNECTRYSGSTVRTADTSDCPATCPPKVRRRLLGVTLPRKMSFSSCSRVRISSISAIR